MNELPQRMVYVDDEPQSRKIATQAMGVAESDSRYFVTCATGRELIARMKELQPDLILLDLRMPDMNGPDTIDQLRKTPSYNHAPVIFVTERTKVTMIDAYKALGVIGVIHKPLDPSTLKSQILGYWADYRAAQTV